MRAAVLVEPGRFGVVEATRPTPGPAQVRVRVEGCGVCASNVPPFEGREWFKYPMEPGRLGHEAWGRVDAVGEQAGRSRSVSGSRSSPTTRTPNPTWRMRCRSSRCRRHLTRCRSLPSHQAAR
jgi:threonine dehydrogenase-like Zn-dependent dehydrogenase